MSELERALSTIGGELDYPPTPALAPAVRARVAAAPSPRRGVRPRAAIALAFAVLLIGAGSAFAASPGLRHSVLDWLGLRSVRSSGYRRLPATPAGDQLCAWNADHAAGRALARHRSRHSCRPGSRRTRCTSRGSRRAARWDSSTRGQAACGC